MWPIALQLHPNFGVGSPMEALGNQNESVCCLWQQTTQILTKAQSADLTDFAGFGIREGHLRPEEPGHAYVCMPPWGGVPGTESSFVYILRSFLR